MAYYRLVRWCNDLSSNAKQAQLSALMDPHAAKRDEEVADKIEAWDKQA